MERALAGALAHFAAVLVVVVVVVMVHVGSDEDDEEGLVRRMAGNGCVLAQWDPFIDAGDEVDVENIEIEDGDDDDDDDDEEYALLARVTSASTSANEAREEDESERSFSAREELVRWDVSSKDEVDRLSALLLGRAVVAVVAVVAVAVDTVLFVAL